MYGLAYAKSPILANSVGNQQRKIGFCQTFYDFIRISYVHKNIYNFNIIYDLSYLKQKQLTLAQ